MTDETTIRNDSVVRMHYRLTDGDGQEIDSSEGGEPLAYLHGHGNLVPGLEQQLDGRSIGETLTAVVPPEEGYGARREDEGMAVPLESLPDDVPLAPGLVLAATTESGETIPVWIVEVAEEHAILTQQHPLAGVTLHFEVEILDIRPATAEELALGHADGAGGAPD